MTLQLLQDYIMLKVEKSPRTHGLLHIPDSAKREHSEAKIGKVLAVGTGRRFKKTGHQVPMEIEVGQRILLDPFAELIPYKEEEGLYFAAQFQVAAVFE